MANKKDDFEKYLDKQLKNKKFKEEYEALESLYNLTETEIQAKQELLSKNLPKR